MLDQIIIKTSLRMILFLSSILLIIVYLIKDYNVSILYYLLFKIVHCQLTFSTLKAHRR